MSFDATNPVVTNEIGDDITNIRTNFVKILSGDVNHTKLSVTKQGSNPTAVTNNFQIFSKLDADSNLELFAQDDAGTPNVTQLTRQGSVGNAITGTFTPTFQGINTGTDATWSAGYPVARYTKSQNIVFVYMHLKWTAWNDAGEAGKVTNLPFTIANNTNERPVFTVHRIETTSFTSRSAGQAMYCMGTVNTTNIINFRLEGGSTGSFIPTATGEIIVQGTYFTSQ